MHLFYGSQIGYNTPYMCVVRLINLTHKNHFQQVCGVRQCNNCNIGYYLPYTQEKSIELKVHIQILFSSMNQSNDNNTQNTKTGDGC